MLKQKINIADALKNVGVTFHTCRTTKALSQSTFTALNRGDVPTGSLDKICAILKMQPGDLIEWVPDEEDPEK